jgi:hypothetical protein
VHATDRAKYIQNRVPRIVGLTLAGNPAERFAALQPSSTGKTAAWVQANGQEARGAPALLQRHRGGLDGGGGNAAAPAASAVRC